MQSNDTWDCSQFLICRNGKASHTIRMAILLAYISRISVDSMSTFAPSFSFCRLLIIQQGSAILFNCFGASRTSKHPAYSLKIHVRMCVCAMNSLSFSHSPPLTSSLPFSIAKSIYTPLSQTRIIWPKRMHVNTYLLCFPSTYLLSCFLRSN